MLCNVFGTGKQGNFCNVSTHPHSYNNNLKCSSDGTRISEVEEADMGHQCSADCAVAASNDRFYDIKSMPFLKNSEGRSLTRPLTRRGRMVPPPCH